jgi:outer membrane protein assembly factor BamB
MIDRIFRAFGKGHLIFVMAFAALWLCLSQPLAAQQVWQMELEGVNSFSSPRVIDLNDDGVKDVVLGGGIEGDTSVYGFVAIDGLNGQILWSHPSDEQVFTSPVFMDLNHDGQKDVILGGRSAQLVAFDGATGGELWEFYTDTLDPEILGLYNFYTGQPIPDQNDDQVMDLLVTNGGDRNADPQDSLRPPGHVMIISGFDGEELAYMIVPDSQETYSSPLVDDFGTGVLWAVYGTGGETVGGGLWRTRVSDILAENPANSELLHYSGTNGYVAPPSLVDLTGDGIYDIVANSFAGQVVAVNGSTGSLIWERTIENGESNVNPGIGQFNQDGVPDIVTTMAIGEWFTYSSFVTMIFDGINGNTLDSTILPAWNLSSYLAADLNSNGVDDIITAFTDTHFNSTINETVFDIELLMKDPHTGETIFQYGPHNGANPFYTPLLCDLDSNGLADLVYVYSADSLNLFSNSGIVIKRLETGLILPESPAWTGYLGTFSDGKYSSTLVVEVGEPGSNTTNVGIDSQGTGELYDLGGKLIENGKLPEDGIYILLKPDGNSTKVAMINGKIL